MSNRHQASTYKASDNSFRLKPLVAGMRVVIAGGLFAGAVAPVHADLPLPAQNWVSSGSATNQIIGNTLRIDQQTDKAILNWDKFNVGEENTVQFVQPGSSSIALNRINDHNPSRIMGQIVANGQVYLYNRNGFVFDKNSVVNTNSLIASTLNISDEVFDRGITQVYDESGSAALVIETKQAGDMLDPKNAKILIEAGAKIHTDKAGRIIIVAPNIENKGSLSTDTQGQIILAASEDKVYLQAADKESPFAGLLVEVGTGGTVTNANAGDIAVRQGNVTLAGFAVNQQGRISATTSVNVNGSIRLLAQEKIKENSDKLLATKTMRGDGSKSQVTLASNSVTQIVADSGGGTAIDDQEQPLSYMEVTGHTVEVQSKAAVKVTGGKVDITATDNLEDPTQGRKGRIFIDQNAVIDVSGTQNVSATMESNVAEISVQSFELRNSPNQLNGVIKSETVGVDLRKDTEIVDTSGAKARISRGIDERLTAGGTINLTSGGDIIVNKDSELNIAGGSVNYQAGYLKTTKLLTDYGRIVDISDADPNEHYVAIYGTVKEVHGKWGVTKVWSIPEQFSKGRYEQGYTEGKAAGALNIKTSQLAWDGTLVAGAASGTNQRAISDTPFGGRFDIDMAVFESVQNVVFQADNVGQQLAAGSKFPKKQNGAIADLVFSESLLNESGVSDFSVKTLGSAKVNEGTAIEMAPLGSFAVEANSIDVNGSIQAAGGNIDLAATVILLADQGDGDASSYSTGAVTLANTSVIDVAGRWVNDYKDRKTASVVTDILNIDGGSVSIGSQGDMVAQAGSVINADGGGRMSAKGKLTGGKGGSISLEAARDGYTPALRMDGSLSAYGFTDGGSLSLSSSHIVIGVADAATDPEGSLVLAVHNGHFDFAEQLGFSAITLNGNYQGIEVKDNTSLDLKTYNLLLRSGAKNQATGGSVRDFTDIVLLPEHQRQALTLNLQATGVVDSDVRLGTGSTLLLDKESTLNLTSTSGSIFVDGTASLPSGSINLKIAPASRDDYDNKQSIWLGEHARLLAAGSTLLNPLDALGRTTGSVLNGGNVTFDAQRGYVVLEQGSLIDVSGARAKLDILQSGNGATAIYGSANLGSDAGDISITAAEGIVLDGDLRGFAGSASNRAGRLDVALDRTRRQEPEIPGIAYPNGELIINIRQSARPRLGNTRFGDVIGDELNGQATLGADQIAAAGFSDLRLTTQDKVVFQGDVDLKTAERIDIDAQSLDWTADGSNAGTVNLDTVYLTIGSSLEEFRSASATPERGTATINAHAQWLELRGGSLWNHFGTVNLHSGHDLRGVGVVSASGRDYVGTLVTAADLNLRASQIYPSTLTDFTFAVKNNADGAITVTSSGDEATPLSAAGSLTLQAPVINQQGILKAPLGIISLQADKTLALGSGSITSVSADGLLIPFGTVQAGSTWLYSLLSGNLNLIFDAPPEKRIELKAPVVDMRAGSMVDVSGGGDLQAYEFKPVADDFPDYLRPGSDSYEGGFAILPALGSAWAPYDHYENNNWSHEAGSSVYLSGTSELSAGYYSILPAHYALLPGAYLVTPQANSQDSTVTRYSADGLPIVSGYRLLAGTSVRDARTTAYRIETHEQVLSKHAQYDIYSANSFYQKDDGSTPLLPADAGQISIEARTKLLLDGSINVAAVDGRGAKMDIVADNIKVVDSLSGAVQDGELEILDSDLSNLNIDSLLLGGTRQKNSDGSTTLSVTADNVTFAAGTQLTIADLEAAALDTVKVESGAALVAEGLANTGDTQLNIVGDGAFLRLSADGQVVLNRTETTGTSGTLILEQGGSLTAAKSMLLDASKSTTLAGDILMHGGSLNLVASVINLGEVQSTEAGALNLGNHALAKLTVDELVLSSRSGVNLYGDVGVSESEALRFDKLVIDAAGFSGFADSGQTARLRVNELTLQNSLGQTAGAGSGHGQFQLQVADYKQGKGNFAFTGFSQVDMTVGNGFKVADNSTLTLAADTNIQAGYLTAAGGKALNINAGGHALQIGGNGSDLAGVGSAGYGGAINVTADSVGFDGNALLYSGKLGLHALTGDVYVGSAAMIDLAGRAVGFADATDYTSGGTFTANAEQGKVILASGSQLDLSSGGGSAAGGNLVLKAPKQNVTLNGQIKAAGGSADIDVATFSAATHFDALMNLLNAAGINNSINFRSRDADIVQAAGGVIDAHNLTLVADKGNIDLFGQLHADSTAEGGSIELYAGDKITLENGSRLTATGGKGGDVLLSSTDEDQDGVSGIALKAGSAIDVGGATDSDGGSVKLRALRTADGVNIQALDGKVKGARRFYAVGVKKYANADLGNDGEINTADIRRIEADTAAYMTAHVIDNVAALGQGIGLMAGVQIDYNGDLTLKDGWDLAGWRYNGNPGELAIKATGNLRFDQSLSDGFRSGKFKNTDGTENTAVTVVDQMLTDESWSYVLTAGADNGSADLNRTAGSGNLVVGTSAKVRTGTGDMRINAGGDITISEAASVIAKPSVKVSKGSLALQIADTSAWKVGADLSGTGISNGTTVVSVDTAGTAKQTTAAVAKGSKTFKVADTSGWVVGDYLATGSNVSANTKITAINTTTKTITLSLGVKSAIASGATLTTTPAVHLSNALTADINTNTKITASYTAGTIYNAGRASADNPYGTLGDTAVAKYFYSEYPIDGGDLILSAGGNINGVASGNDYNDWLVRIGSWDGDSGQPTAWGVALGYIYADPSKQATQPTRSLTALFQQNLGSFGGGNVSVKAAGNISNLEVVIPTTGKPVGINTISTNLNGYTSNEVLVNGGGNMLINAGGNIAGGSYYLGRGEGVLNAGGKVTVNADYASGPALFAGDARFSVNAATGVQLSGVFDPMIGHDDNVNFFSYTDSSAVSVKSLSGDIDLSADNNVATTKNGFSSNQIPVASIYPGSLQATAFGGSVVLTDDIILYPSAQGQLNIYAKQDISASDGADGYYKLGMSDADSSLLPTWHEPKLDTGLEDAVSRISPYGLANFVHAPTPVHAEDDEPARLVTSQGDIRDIAFNSPKKAIIKAGRDISNSALAVQNLNADDVTILDAGRDLIYPSKLDALTGGLVVRTSDSEALTEPGIKIAGPGDVLLKTGRNVDLGSSNGLSTVGNTYNSGLSDQGADITVLAGLNGASANYADFISKYQPDTASIQSVIDIVKNMPDSEDKTYILGKLESLIKLSADSLRSYAVVYGADLQTLRNAFNQPKQLLQTELSSLNLLKKIPGIDKKDLNDKINAVKTKIDNIETLNVQVDMLENGNKLIAGFMQGYMGNPQLTNAQALAGFKTLSKTDTLQIQPQLDILVAPVLFKEIKHAGTASGDNKSLGNTGGYEAIDSLFPGSDWKGDLSLFFSKLQTLKGGDINLLVPGGEINAGLSVSVSGAKSADKLGIVAQGEGNINALVRDDFLVNKSRVFSLAGGDIMIWSSEGDIDAGKGAKSSISAPPPIITVDKNGNLKIEFPPVVSGSGIRTASSSDGVEAGDVYLFAPKGVIDAGEAGIGGNNVTLVATAILGANNIQFSGAGTGVPVAASGSVAAGLTGTSNMTAGVSQAAESSVGNNVAKDTGNPAKALLGLLSVEILGFGD